MSILYLLIPISLLLLGIAIWAFVWAVDNDQFEDLDGPAYSILFDDDEGPATERPSGQERSEASYAESYFGGHSEYYDVIKTDSYQTSFTDGSLDDWNSLWDLCELGFETDAKYYAVQGKDASGNNDTNLTVQVDIDDLIDYMTDIF